MSNSIRSISKLVSSTFGSSIAAFLFTICFCFSGTSFSAVLNVDLDVRTRVPESDQNYQKKHVAIFVLDRSGSMIDFAPEDPSQRRNALLRKSVKERIHTLSNTAPSTQVYFLPFSGWIDKMEHFSLDSESSKKDAFNWIDKNFDTIKCKGDTVLYDTLAYALDFADDLINEDPRIKIQIFGYTDGQNCTPKYGILTNFNINASSRDIREKLVSVKFQTKNEFNENERNLAFQKYKEMYGRKIEQFINDGNMDDDIQWRWLGKDEPPKGVKNTRKDEYKMTLKTNASALKNPSAVSEQSMPAILVIPIPSEYEKDLSNLSAKLVFEVNGKKVSDVKITLGGANKVLLNIPDDTSEEQFKGLLYITDIPDKWERILLKPPSPIEVEFSASYESALTIESPSTHDQILLGSKDNKNWKVSVKTKDTNIKQVKWIIENKKTGKKFEGKHTAPVHAGAATCACPFDLKIGKGEWVLWAEAVYDAANNPPKPIVSPKIDLETIIDDKLSILINVDGVTRKKWERDVLFGQKVELVADCGGCVDKTNVEWSTKFDGKERPVGKGEIYKAQQEAPNGDNSRTVNYIARVKLPDGSIKEAINWVNYYCGCFEFEAALKLQEKDGVTKTSFGLNNDPVNTEIVCYKQGVPVHVELKDAVIDMGDGTNYNARVVNNHFYNQYGTYEIRASAKCKYCGKPYTISPVHVKVEKQPPKASFEIEEKGTYYTVGGKIHLNSTSTGDIENYVWFADGKELTEYTGKPKAVVPLPSTPCEIEVRLEVTGPQGADPSEPAIKKLKVRFGWWLIILLLLAGLLIWWFVLYKLLRDNGPAGWRIIAWGRQEPERTEKGKAREKRNAANMGMGMQIRKFWSLADKKAIIPIDKLGLDMTTLGQFAATDVVSIEEINHRPSLGGFTSGTKVDYIQNIGDRNKLFYLFKPDPSACGKREPRYVRVILDASKRSHGYQILLVISTLAMLAGIAWLTIIYAI